LMVAIRSGNAVDIESLVHRGAPLLPHYYSIRLEAQGGLAHEARDGSWSSKGPRPGLVNPVDWAAMERCWRPAMQLLRLGDSQIVFNRDEHQSFLTEVDLAKGTRRAVNVAAFHGQHEFLTMLLERSADVGQKNTLDQSALHVAVLEDRPQIADLLLKHGAWACEEQRREVLARSLTRRMKCVLDAAGVMAIAGEELAAEALPQWSEMVQHLAVHENADDKAFRLERIHERGQSPVLGNQSEGTAAKLTLASRSLPSSPVSLLQPVPPDSGKPNVPLPSHRDPTKRELRMDQSEKQAELMTAIQKGDVHRITSLVLHGTVLDGSFDLGYGEEGNCLDWACAAERPAVALVLLDLADARGLGRSLASVARAALYWSILHGYLDVLQALLKHGADVGLRPPHGSNHSSALALAVFSWREAEAVELLRHGAWEREPESRRRELAEYLGSRKALRDAFNSAGIAIAVS